MVEAESNLISDTPPSSKTVGFIKFEAASVSPIRGSCESNGETEKNAKIENCAENQSETVQKVKQNLKRIRRIRKVYRHLEDKSQN